MLDPFEPTSVVVYARTDKAGFAVPCRKTKLQGKQNDTVFHLSNLPAVLAARRNRVKMCSALDTEDDLVLPARCSVKPCSNIDQDDDEAPVPQRQMRKPRQTSQSPVRASTSMKSPVRVEVSTSQSRAASPVRRGARSGPGTGAGVRVGSPVRVGQRGGTSPRRSPTRSRPVKIAGPLTKPEQRAALLRQRLEKQTLLEMLQRDLESRCTRMARSWGA